MKRIRVVPLTSNLLTKLSFCLIISFSLVAVNLYFFSFFDTTVRTSLNFFGYNDENDNSKTVRACKLAIIIDDFGQNRDGVREMLSINRHMTVAIMPFLQFSKADAEAAYQNGHEVIVHLPMESNNGKLSWVGPRPILSVMSDNEVYQIVIDSFDDVPHAVGANIHMGAKVGNDERIISSVLDVIKSKRLYFVDSRSSSRPIAKKIADEKGVLCYDRDIFLDGTKSKDTIKKQLKKAADISLQRGKAVAIGHVGTEGGKITAQAIREMLPYFDEKKIELVYVSELGRDDNMFLK